MIELIGGLVIGGVAGVALKDKILGDNNQNNNKQTSVSSIDRNSSIFNQFNVEATGLNPFASVNKVQTPVQGVVPVNARENYRNGLAPSSDLQNVYAGHYNGKANILNQIAIA